VDRGIARTRSPLVGPFDRHHHTKRHRLVTTFKRSTDRAAASPRRSREELRSVLIKAGLDVLRENGLSTGAEGLTFKRVFEHVAATSGIRVTNASVIGRIWQNLAEYQGTVLALVAAEEVADLELAAAEASILSLKGVDLSTLEGRSATLTQLLRVSADSILDSVAISRRWALVIGAWALTSGSRGNEVSEPIHQALAHGFALTDARSVATTESLMDFLGLRLRSPLRVDQYISAQVALVDGCGLRDRADPSDMRGIDRPTGPGGAMEEWTVLAIGMEALADQFFEFDPDWSPPPEH